MRTNAKGDRRRRLLEHMAAVPTPFAQARTRESAKSRLKTCLRRNPSHNAALFRFQPDKTARKTYRFVQTWRNERFATSLANEGRQQCFALLS